MTDMQIFAICLSIFLFIGIPLYGIAGALKLILKEWKKGNETLEELSQTQEEILSVENEKLTKQEESAKLNRIH